LGAIVGEVEEVDTNELGIGWGEYVRVRTKINITKPLCTGTTVEDEGSIILDQISV
jgi:hypothetical protein